MEQTFEEYVVDPRWQKFFHTLAYKYERWYSPHNHEDLVQEARIGAWRGWEAWTEEKCPATSDDTVAPRWRWAIGYAKRAVQACVFNNYDWTGRANRNLHTIIEDRFDQSGEHPVGMWTSDDNFLDWYLPKSDDIADKIISQLTYDTIMGYIQDPDLREYLELRLGGATKRDALSAENHTPQWLKPRIIDLQAQINDEPLPETWERRHAKATERLRELWETRRWEFTQWTEIAKECDTSPDKAKYQFKKWDAELESENA